jgi:predicted patatin/cPLA2 family phospholipase
LVVEGGGMRGVFSAGVLDAFLEAGFDPFGLYVGTSAGACNLSSHVAGQLRRNYRLYTGPMRTGKFMSLGRFLRGGHFMDLDWLWNYCDREDPLDVAACARNTRDREFVAVCTSVETGRPVYLRPGEENWNAVLKASSAMPVLYKTPLVVDSQRLVDGGVADAVPVEEAHRRGATRIVVVRSQTADYVKKGGMEAWITGLLSRKHPRLRETMRHKAETYLRSWEFIENPPGDTEVVQIAPRRALRSGRTTRHLGSLQEDYELGKSQGRDFLGAWRE